MNDIITLPPNSLAGRGVGHNSAAVPLAERLAEELAADKARAAELMEAAAAARIENATDAGKVADLIVLLREHERGIDRERDARKRPLLHDQRIIESAYGAVIGPLVRARTDTLMPLLDAWQQEHPDAAPATTIAAMGSRRQIEFSVEDLTAAVAWLLEHHPGSVAQAARTIIGAELRALGVDAAASVVIPGVSVTVNQKTMVR